MTDLADLAQPSPSAAFDFGTLSLKKLADEAQELELFHPVSQDGLGVFVMVRGFAGESFKQHARRESNAERRRKFAEQRKAKDATVRLTEEDEEVGLRLTTSLLAGWRTVIGGVSKPVVIINGIEREFTPENVAAWLRDYDWVIPQINEFAGEAGNFTSNSAKSSPNSPPPASS